MESQMESYRLWEPPVSHVLDTVTGHLVDMASAHTFLQRLAILSQGSETDGTAMEAYAVAAVIRYCRCFSSGSRAKLRIKDLETATSAEIELHDHLRGVRDWHIAHPVNQQEVHAVHLIVAPSRNGEFEVRGASSFSAAALPLDSVQAELAISLTNKWLDLLKKRIVDEQLRLRPYAQALSREELLALPERNPEPNRDIRARRQQSRDR